jgi:hypothetical protein
MMSDWKYGSESYDFYSHCAEWSLPRLKELRNNTQSFPTSLVEEHVVPNQFYFDFFMEQGQPDLTQHWKHLIDKMIWSMEIIASDDCIWTKKDHGRIQEGLSLFAKHFRDLWD